LVFGFGKRRDARLCETGKIRPLRASSSAAEKSRRRLDGHNQLPKAIGEAHLRPILGSLDRMTVSSGDRGLGAITSRPVRHSLITNTADSDVVDPAPGIDVP